MTSRHRARSIALQILYEIDSTTHRAEEVLARLVYDDSVEEATYDFVATLVQGTLKNLHQSDALIARHATAFPVQQMAVIDRSILRIALFELLNPSETPVRVCINEAVELAKEFGGDGSPALVNGVLGAIVRSWPEDGSSQ
ncbi:MAG: transcription antitermination factor NusB [Dehalococcoidia bacterium]|nr:transcription antitermination factor NusB [Dehalococcoidia bacterium]